MLALSYSQASSADTPICDVGPIKKTFGGTSWLVYSCKDSPTLVIVTAIGSPATPFVFLFYQENGAYRLRGMGAGNKGLTDAAYEDLRLFTEQNITALILETKSVSIK